MSEGDVNDRRFPRRIVALGLCTMLLLTIVSAGLALATRRQVQTLTESQLRVILGSQRLKRLAQVSQLTVQLAVRTGDARYAADQKAQQGEVEQTYRELARSVVPPANLHDGADVVRLGRQVARIEATALELQDSGRADRALQLLGSAEYQSLESRYLGDLAAMRGRSTDYAAQLQHRIDFDSRLALIADLVGLPLMALAWLLVLLPARRWGGEVEQAWIRAQGAADAKTEFVAVLSHELRNPLNGIRGFTELLLDDETLTTEQRGRVEGVDEAGDALMSVIEHVLDFSALEAGKMSLESHRFALRHLVEHAVSLVGVVAELKSLELRSHTDPRASELYVGDEQRLRQILLNLLNNAIKFTAAGWVELKVTCVEQFDDSDLLRFEIADSGPGIASDIQARLFESYSRGDADSSAEHGSGLGLNICKRLVALMGGDIGVESAVGTGARFWFDLRLPKAVEVEDGPAG